MKAEQLARYLRVGTTESSRRLIAYRCAMVLLVIACSLAAVICYQGMMLHAVDNGLLTALTFIVGIIAALAREIYHRNDVGVAAPPAIDGASPVQTASGESATDSAKIVYPVRP